MLKDQQLIDSLQPGRDGALKTRTDGTVLEGHHRLTILRERSIDLDALLREIVAKDSPATGRRTVPSKLYWIKGPWRGRLVTMPRPRGGDWLEDEVCDWREAGIDVVVSLLTTDEVGEFDLDAEPGFVKPTVSDSFRSRFRIVEYPLQEMEPRTL
jgi:hypothetical protein